MTEVEGDQIFTKIDATNALVATALLTTPAWVIVFREISIVAGAVAAICGAIVGIVTVFVTFSRLLRRVRKTGVDAAE